MDPDQLFERVRDVFAGQARIIERPMDRNGYCHVARNGTARVFIRRGLVGMQRFATLVHELGHLISRQQGRPQEYERAVSGDTPCDDWTTNPIEERRAVLAEEVKAWRLGLDLARDHGLLDEAEFFAAAHAGLENYRPRLALPDVEFDQAVAAIRGTARPVIRQDHNNVR